MNYWNRIKSLFKNRKAKIKEYKIEIKALNDLYDRNRRDKKEKPPYLTLSQENELRRLKVELKGLRLNTRLSKHFKYTPSFGSRERYPHRIPSNNKILRDKYLKINQAY